MFNPSFGKMESNTRGMVTSRKPRNVRQGKGKLKQSNKNQSSNNHTPRKKIIACQLHHIFASVAGVACESEEIDSDALGGPGNVDLDMLGLLSITAHHSME